MTSMRTDAENQFCISLQGILIIAILQSVISLPKLRVVIICLLSEAIENQSFRTFMDFSFMINYLLNA